MAKEKNQLIKIDGKDVFLVLTERTGSDFTFYLRNDKEESVRQVLKRASGETISSALRQNNASEQSSAVAGRTERDALSAPSGNEKSKDKLSSQKSNYSCRAYILKPILDKKDLKTDLKNEKQVIFLQRLLEAKSKATGKSPYHLLQQKLPRTWEAIAASTLEDKNLIKILITELNELLSKGSLKLLSQSLATVVEASEEKELLAQIKDRHAKKKLSNYIKFCALFSEAIEPLASRVKVGRVLAGLSYESEIWSLSFREQERGAGYDADKETDGNLNSIEELCQSLYEEIFYAISQSEANTDKGQGKTQKQEIDKTQYREKIDAHRRLKLPEMSGLVVITGSTNSAKSLITRGLIQLFLDNVNQHPKPKRLPHLVTFEDPIEKYFATKTYKPERAHAQLDISMSASEKNIDYTPRQQRLDVKNLPAALRDALRQTPKVFFVGETRLANDWHELINFAGTGHLVITTAHAGSLVEAMHKIFLATKARTPADRSEVAGRLLAVVHLKRAEVGESRLGVLVPALWRRVPRGLNALTAEGLASVLPHSHSNDRSPSSCLGRGYFVKRLIQLAGNRPSIDDENLKRLMMLQAIEWDLQGA